MENENKLIEESEGIEKDENSEDDNPEAKLDFSYDIICKKLERQANASNSVENKTGILYYFIN